VVRVEVREEVVCALERGETVRFGPLWIQGHVRGAGRSRGSVGSGEMGYGLRGPVIEVVHRV
jgi:hypothetical protein